MIGQPSRRVVTQTEERIMKANLTSFLWLVLTNIAVVHTSEARTWLPDSFIANGSGCLLGAQDTELTVYDDRMLVSLMGLGLRLPAASGRPFADRKFCSLSIEFETVDKHYPQRFFQSLTFGAKKSANASAILIAQSSFGELALPALEFSSPAGAVIDEAQKTVSMEIELIPNLLEPDDWCDNPMQAGVFATRIVAQGFRTSDADDLILAPPNSDQSLTFTAGVDWVPCPNSSDDSTPESKPTR